jgi:hypothetical protein
MKARWVAAGLDKAASAAYADYLPEWTYLPDRT